jgi:hypothetical protein
VNALDAKPLREKLLNSNRETTMHKEMVIVLFGLLAKWTKPTIFPTSPP